MESPLEAVMYFGRMYWCCRDFDCCWGLGRLFDVSVKLDKDDILHLFNHVLELGCDGAVLLGMLLCDGKKEVKMRER